MYWLNAKNEYFFTMGNGQSAKLQDYEKKSLGKVPVSVESLFDPTELAAVKRLYTTLAGRGRSRNLMATSQLENYFKQHVAGKLARALAIYFCRIERTLSKLALQHDGVEVTLDVATAVPNISFAAFGNAVYNLCRSTSDNRASVMLAYEVCEGGDKGDDTRQFLSDLAASALAFYELTGTRKHEEHADVHSIAVEPRFVDFLLQRLRRKLRALNNQPQSLESSLETIGIYSSTKTPNASSDSLNTSLPSLKLADVGRGLSEEKYISKLWELFVEHLFFQPFSNLQGHADNFSGNTFSAAGTNSGSSRVESAHLALADALNEELVNLRANGFCRPRYLHGHRSDLMTREDLWMLDMTLEAGMRQIAWNELYSSKKKGKSWTLFSGAVTNKGATLIVVRDTGGYVFGGFASEPWISKPDFYGNSNCFLFTLQPKMQVFTPSGYNSHYQYFTHNTVSLINGLAMGGQKDYWGLFISDNFEDGASQADPTSTTFESSQLSSSQFFKIDTVEAWLVKQHELTEDDGFGPDPHRSVLDKNPDSIAMLEMFGRPMYSQQVRDPDVYTDD